MIKKMLLLASMALAVVAVAAPAAHATTDWTDLGNFTIEGEITSERGGLVTGPGEVDLNATLEEGGTGTITGGAITGTVPTNLPNCHAKGTIDPTGTSLPWSISLDTTGKVSIGGVTFANDYTTTSNNEPGCAAFGVPPFVPVSGTVTGQAENQGGTEVCINLNAYTDDLFIEGGVPGAVDLTGVVCIEGTEA